VIPSAVGLVNLARSYYKVSPKNMIFRKLNNEPDDYIAEDYPEY